jgi:NAD(P)H-hydrate epimerase
MAATAAARIGAGLVTVGVPASLNPIFEVKLTVEMTEPLPESVSGYLGRESAERILTLAEGKQCVVIGPGLSTHDGIPDLMKAVLHDYDGWILIDADGLNALVGNLETLKSARGNVVLTPHPGEMGRLVGKSSREVQEDRLGIARQVASDYGIWLVLKGAATLTVSPEGMATINPTGNPWMASGGQGDALSGMLGGLLAQGIRADEALPFGVYLHGLAADRIVERLGPAPVLATDLINELPALLGTEKE